MHKTVSLLTHTRTHTLSLAHTLTHTHWSELLCEVSPESDSNDSVWRLTPAGTPLHSQEKALFEKYLLVKLGNNGATRTL